MEVPNKGDLRVWWIPQIPGDIPFRVAVNSVGEAKLILDTLANYDNYQLEHNIKPDYSNVGGLEVYETEGGLGSPSGWVEWHDKEDRDIDEVMRE